MSRTTLFPTQKEKQMSGYKVISSTVSIDTTRHLVGEKTAAGLASVIDNLADQARRAEFHSTSVKTNTRRVHPGRCAEFNHNVAVVPGAPASLVSGQQLVTVIITATAQVVADESVVTDTSTWYSSGR